MPRVAGIRFRRAGKIYYFDPNDLKLEENEQVIVETSRGIELGEVVLPEKEVEELDLVFPLKKVLRKATEDDLAKARDNRRMEADCLLKCQQQIERHKLEMKLVGAEYTFDRSKVIFYFTSEGRVDFRELVKDLASIFRTRIELRQIGVRDEAKLLGGLGPCGRSICCVSFLEEFEPVSIRMAKGQNLSLNPSKISGVCGRLMCCLRFEMETYEDSREDLPRPGDKVVTPEGEGRVEEVNLTGKTIRVKLHETGYNRDFPKEEVDLLE
ncbi:MAG TPA: stage 0 sporulation family protein [Firmicutes bacterium]|nr:stage 0 sporulation family protein [Bacillota bacterium]